MSRLNEVLNRLAPVTEAEAAPTAAPAGAVGYYRLDAYLASLRDGSAQKPPQEAMLDILWNDDLAKAVAKVEDGDKLAYLKAIVQCMKACLDDELEKPVGAITDMGMWDGLIKKYDDDSRVPDTDDEVEELEDAESEISGVENVADMNAKTKLDKVIKAIIDGDNVTASDKADHSTTEGEAK